VSTDPRPRIPAASPQFSGAFERGYYSVSEAAAVLGVSRMSVWRWIRAGRLPAARIGPRTTRIARPDLEAWLAQHGPDGHHSWVARRRGPEHVVQFYEADAFLLDAITEFIGGALRAGEAAVVVATAAHRRGLEDRLQSGGLAVAAAQAHGRYVALDAAETLSRFMVDGEIDPERFTDVVGGIVGQAARGGRRVRIFGEMVALLALGGDHELARELEELWNGLLATHGCALLCAYPIDSLAGEALSELLGGVCDAHSRVIPTDSYTSLEDPDDRLRAVALLEQKAAALKAADADRRRLEATAYRLAAIVESSDDAILGKTLDGIVTDWNRGAERLYGYTPAEIIGQPVSILMPDDRPDEFPSIMERLQRGERIDHYETERVAKNGRRLSVSVTISPIRDGTGQIVGASAIARDISERRALERMQSDFLAMVSHELRSPLATVKGLAQLMQRRGAYSERSLDGIVAQVNHLDRLVGDLLDVARLEAGRLELSREPVDLVKLVAENVHQAQARTEDHVLRVEAPAPQLTGSYDRVRLNQVLQNLLGNAIKYAPGGQILVRLVADGTEARISVADEGPGIAQEEAPRLFERFYRAAATADGAKGFGIGLYVARTLVEAHGGRIWVAPRPGPGTEFIFTLPLGPASADS
jgi:PAS domain S-box-containing protein/excisionase family DNA binding protein